MTVLRDTTGKCLPFWYTQFEPRRDMKDDGRKKGKIYRNCFGLQPEPIRGITANKAVPSLFRNRFIKDVTVNYSGENQLTIPIWQEDAEAYVYLGVFSPGKWIPVDIAKPEKQQATFRNVESDIIYLPIFYNNGSSHPAGYPFLPTQQGCRQLILGRQTAIERELHYQVPANALLWLRNLTKGRKEHRCFDIET